MLTASLLRLLVYPMRFWEKGCEKFLKCTEEWLYPKKDTLFLSILGAQNEKHAAAHGNAGGWRGQLIADGQAAGGVVQGFLRQRIPKAG